MKKNMKGTTVVEVVISFAIVALAVGTGLLAIGVGSNFINRGAELKHQRSDAQVAMTLVDESEEIKVKIDGNDVLVSRYASIYDGEEVFYEYRLKTTP